MYWGAGPALGLLTFLGYFLFSAGAALLWRSRGEVSAWAQDEFGGFRRSLSRHTLIGPFYGPREVSLVRVVPSYFVRSIRRIPRSPAFPAAVLLLVGPLLLLLDFFI
jgi:hypothetical protein